ncbi:MAG TPA: ABC transporter permease [Anaerolineaceae bacterium]
MKALLKSNQAREILRIFTAVFVALLIGFIVTLFVSEDPIQAYRAFLLGPVSRFNRFGDWIEESLTLMLLGLAIALVFKAQIFSLGAEGQMAMGALASGVIALWVPLPIGLRIPLALVGGALAGFLLGIIPGYLKAYLNANEIVSTLMLNTIALKIYEYLLTYYIKSPNAGYTASDTFPTEGILPTFVPNLSFLQGIRTMFVNQTNLTVMIYLVITSVIVVYYLMYRTPFGYELRIIGSNIKFAGYGGMNTKKAIMLATAVSGIFAGLAGTHLSMAIHTKLIINITAGLGFEGIVVALLARNNPLWIPLSALGYGYLRAGADVMERSSDVSREMVLVIQAIIILLVTAERIFPEVRRRIQARRANNTVEPTSQPGS